VKSSVATALNHELELPLSNISDVRYENGLLTFYDTDGKRMKIMERKSSGERKDVFKPADAQAFIAAFKAKKRSF
jgi:hypothetical protein